MKKDKKESIINSLYIATVESLVIIEALQTRMDEKSFEYEQVEDAVADIKKILESVDKLLYDDVISRNDFSTLN